MGAHFAKASYTRLVWTLIDSDSIQGGGIPSGFLQKKHKLFVIYATSPVEKRWSRLFKSTFVDVIVMNPWNRSEILQALVMSYNCTLAVPYSCNLSIFSASLIVDALGEEEFRRIDKTYKRYGPNPRLSFAAAMRSSPWDTYLHDARSAMARLTLENLKKLVFDRCIMRDCSDKICLIRRAKIDVASGFLIVPMTDYVESQLAIRMRNQSIRQLVEVFHKFHNLNSSRGMSGVIFENICHQIFQRRIQIKYVSMVRLVRDHWKNKPEWCSSHCVFSEIRELENLRQATSCSTLDVRPRKTCYYDDEQLTLEPGVYYIPRKPSEVAFDSFICFKGLLYIFQFTGSEERSIDSRLISRFAKCTNVPKRRNWRFIFIIPNSVKQLKCPFPESRRLQSLQPFSSQVSVDELSELVTSRGSFNAPSSHYSSLHHLSIQEGEESEAAQESEIRHVSKKMKLTEARTTRPNDGSRRFSKLRPGKGFKGKRMVNVKGRGREK